MQLFAVIQNSNKNEEEVLDCFAGQKIYFLTSSSFGVCAAEQLSHCTSNTNALQWQIKLYIFQ